MKRIFYVIALFFICTQAYSFYSTPGTGRNWNLDSLVANSSGHISYLGGVYFINDTLVVSQSDTIKILINTTIKLYFRGWVNVFGTLIIYPPDSVNIIAVDTSQKYIGLTFQSTSNSSLLKKMVFEYGTSVNLIGCNILIDSCKFRFNALYATVPRGAIYLSSNSNPTISNCLFFRNVGPAVSTPANSNTSPTILNNLIIENNSSNANVPQISIGSTNSNALIIKDNIIRGYYTKAGAISIFPGPAPLVKIENNIIKKNRYGISLMGTNINAYIRGNIIDSNNIQVFPDSGGSGIYVYSSGVNTIISRNVIRWNLWGISIDNNSKPVIGNINNADTSDNGLNLICYNKHYDSTFDVALRNTVDTIMAQNNYWGTNNLDSIEAHIWDKIDNPALGFVNIIPIANTTYLRNDNSAIPSDYKLYDAYPNPFNPETNIKFEIPKISSVKIEIFDISGKLVETLLNKNINAGTYSIKWNAKNQSSGIYFYRLSSGSFIETQKLILLK